MKVIRGLGELGRKNRPRTAATIGNFYAVHKGHQALLKRVQTLAGAMKARGTVMTFEPHPQKVLHGAAPPVLVSPEKKLALLEEAGVQQVVILPFTRELSRLEPEEFIKEILVQELRIAALVVGGNFRFGRFARGDVAMLRSFSKIYDYKFETARMVELDGRSVSSTAIRYALENGDLKWANKALGRQYRLAGIIVSGAGRGKKLGYPTANMQPGDGLVVPGPGIYAGTMIRGIKKLPAAISIGHNPTFGQNPLSVEAYVLDFDGNLYGKKVEFEFVARLRDHIEFTGTPALKQAMAEDVEKTRRLLGQR